MIHIYFAHAIADYDTEYENQCIELIKKEYPECVIHNPKELNKILAEQGTVLNTEIGRFKSYFFPEIRKCNILIAAPLFTKHKNNEVTFMSGTAKEISYAKEHNKKVMTIINNKIVEL